MEDAASLIKETDSIPGRLNQIELITQQLRIASEDVLHAWWSSIFFLQKKSDADYLMKELDGILNRIKFIRQQVTIL